MSNVCVVLISKIEDPLDSRYQPVPGAPANFVVVVVADVNPG
jgi:hypothetical protein